LMSHLVRSDPEIIVGRRHRARHRHGAFVHRRRRGFVTAP
jgi:hypothetical protein